MLIFRFYSSFLSIWMLRRDPESSCASHLYWLSCPHPDPSRRISANYCLNRGNLSLSRLTWAQCDIHSQFSNLWKPPLEVLDTGLSHVLWGISGITGCCRVALQTDTVEVSWTVKSLKISYPVSWPQLNTWLEKCLPHYSAIIAESIFMVTMFI